MAASAYSWRTETWRRLRRNKGALAALVWIGISGFIALFAYWLAPDNSPAANLQTVEIQARPPGYRQSFLRISQQPPVQQSWWTTLLYGQPRHDQLIPISGYRVSGDQLEIKRFIDQDTFILQQYSVNALTQGHPEKLLTDHLETRRYWLGTDKFGRDILSRLLVGTRVSLAVGLVAVLISLLLGVALGALAGYYRGGTDAFISWLLNVTWSIPTLLMVFAITLALGKGFWQVFVAVGLTMWVNVARLVRGQVMALREREFVQAARVLGFSDARILLKHILPNITGPVLVLAAGNFASAIMIEAGLSFLGIGIQPPQPSWGLMIREHYNFIITHHPFLALIPGFAIMLLVLAFNLLGNGLRDAVDVRD